MGYYTIPKCVKWLKMTARHLKKQMAEVIHVENEKEFLRGRMWGRLTFLLVVALELMIFCVGCARFEVSDSGEPLLYDVCDETMLPDELVTIIDKKKENPFNLV